MSTIAIIGLDIAKNVFQVHGAAADGAPVLRKQIRHGQVLTFFANLPPCVVALEACFTAHFWAREIGKIGHEVRMIPPQYVKPFGAPRRRVLPVEEGSTQRVVDSSGS